VQIIILVFFTVSSSQIPAIKSETALKIYKKIAVSLLGKEKRLFSETILTVVFTVATKL
jgi:hypothetical protein